MPHDPLDTPFEDWFAAQDEHSKFAVVSAMAHSRMALAQTVVEALRLFDAGLLDGTPTLFSLREEAEKIVNAG